jgi:iron(III) transport system substrate-binding protein
MIMRMSMLVALAALLAIPATAWPASEVTVYSARIEQLIRPLFDAFTRHSGIGVRFITDKEGPLLERLRTEGANTSADLLLTVDAGNLWQAAESGLLQPVRSAALEANIPAHLRDSRGLWFGLSVRARTIVYNSGRVKPPELSTYEDLASPKWKGRVCLRTSKKVYNQSLVAMLLAQHGEATTQRIVRGWVDNLAAPVFADDTMMMDAIAAGQCDVGIVNTYYFGRLKQKSPELPLALYWPNQGSSGVHVNISGAGVTRHAKNRAGAIELLEWLSSPAAQRLYADANLEYPANPVVEPDPLVASWGTFKQNPINVAKAGELQSAAVKLMDRAGYR